MLTTITDSKPLVSAYASRVLREEFERRVAQNPRISMRAYARSAGLSPATMSLVLRGLRFLGPNRVEVVADRLGIQGERRELFRREMEMGMRYFRS